MKEIKAFIRPDRFGAVIDALHEHPELPGVTVCEVRGFGRTVGRTSRQEEGRIRYGTTKMFQLECVVNDEMLDGVLQMIQTAAHTGQVGDGKVFVYDVVEMVKIRAQARSTRIE